ncbi:TetR/AcrR family transcriptional regulator [Pengzhenrongella sicca]|uniref:TetR/AcrR family transcriptional regulator n=1 Tax=Pengzhenrongella sicca TaxID=2819238 RepID=A0A8A4ZB47_9MICO|nr:TetR/AcrR family transcriptional regulator [Pengzhenrongella sicca]QTE28103.1 TetR/AcrR family transcriptional regulator [Pengzhenrongella sicca]
MLRAPTTPGARRTLERILDAALDLFNTSGSAAVTTNHIAAAAGVSPGNLYYWFRDKDEIVRELYARLVAEYEVTWAAGAHDAVELSPHDLLDRLAAGAELTRRYAFLGRDLLGLLHADPVLAAQYKVVRAGRLATFMAIARRWRADGTIRPIGDHELADLVQAVWILAETWFAFVELDDPDPAADDGARLLRVVLAPYLG